MFTLHKCDSDLLSIITGGGVVRVPSDGRNDPEATDAIRSGASWGKGGVRGETRLENVRESRSGARLARPAAFLRSASVALARRLCQRFLAEQGDVPGKDDPWEEERWQGPKLP